MEQGHLEEMIIKQAVRSGLTLPDKIQNAPSIAPGLELYYLAFLRLNSSRQVGFGPGPISWLTIEQYSTVNGLDSDQREAMHHHIVEMDTAYLKIQAKKAK